VPASEFPAAEFPTYRSHVLAGAVSEIISRLRISRRTSPGCGSGDESRNTGMSITPQDLQKLLDEREASRASRKRAWEKLQEIRWVLKDVTGVDLPPPARKTIDLEGRLVKDGVRTALRDRQDALSELVEAIRKYRKLAEKTPLTLQGSDFAQAVEELNKAIDRAEGLMLH
jgi:hypothetical protein